jgi:arylsulfatase A-like enzyme
MLLTRLFGLTFLFLLLVPATAPAGDDEIAGSLVFDQAYSAAQSTPTSFAAAFTGKYPFEVFLGWALADSVTLAGTLREAGYTTAGFFNNRQLDPERKFDQGFDTYEVVYEPDEEKFVQRPLRWLEANRSRPVFMWVHFISPHAPYDYRDMASRFYSPDYEGIFEDGSGPVDELSNDVTGEELDRLKELYAGEVFYADFLFGRMMDSLREMGLLENSLVVLTADHGEELMDHGVLFHDQVYEEIIRIPLIIHHPAMDGGRRTDVPVSNLDFFPTLTALVGVEAPTDLNGMNLLGSSARVWPLVSTSMTNAKHRSMSLRSDRFKLIAKCRSQNKESFELYDLVMDPGELNDLAATHPVEVDSLAAVLKEITALGPCRAISSAGRGASPTRKLSEKKIKQLKSLGYVR